MKTYNKRKGVSQKYTFSTRFSHSFRKERKEA